MSLKVLTCALFLIATVAHAEPANKPLVGDKAPPIDPLVGIHQKYEHAPMQIGQPDTAERALGDELIACVRDKVGLRAALIRAQSALKTTDTPIETKDK